MGTHVVYLTVYRGNRLPPFYIGSSSKPQDILAGKYHGSVTSGKYKGIWRRERSDNPHLFKTIILQHFSSNKEAVLREREIQEFFHVADNPMYINMSVANGGGLSEESIEKLRYKRSIVTRQKMSAASKGVPKSKGHVLKNKLWHLNRGPPPIEHCRAVSLGMMGKSRGPRPPEVRRKISLTMEGRKRGSYKKKIGDLCVT
jgi:hypothetical protein